MFPVLQGNTFEQSGAAVGSLKFEPALLSARMTMGLPGSPSRETAKYP